MVSVVRRPKLWLLVLGVLFTYAFVALLVIHATYGALF